MKFLKVIEMLRPNGGYIVRGEDYEGIEFIECEPFTKQEFIDGFAELDEIENKKQEELLAKKLAAEAKLSALGLTAEDLRALGLV